VNERDQWGPRMTRAIPRRWWLTGGRCFLFYSGALGGVLFSLVALWRDGLGVWAPQGARSRRPSEYGGHGPLVPPGLVASPVRA